MDMGISMDVTPHGRHDHERASGQFATSYRTWKLVLVAADRLWVVKHMVGGKLAIVVTKLPITYVYQPTDRGLAEYFEANLDIMSSAAARNVLAVVRSYT